MHLNLEHRLLTKQLRYVSNDKTRFTVESLLSTYKYMVQNITQLVCLNGTIVSLVENAASLITRCVRPVLYRVVHRYIA
ncbi:hypothetical protein Riv7116_1652 [Rivularia sp. PCC 7116]|nr:hypothetical protein Riv7116_1652 [Rivularia sp. PCC 7116]